MADQLLSIVKSTLDGIANAIRSKGGTSSSLSFPSGFVSALNNIETEATITPKIAAQTRYLTTSKKSQPIEAGFHDGNGTINIRTQSKSVTPAASQIDVTPDSGYFLSSVSVAGIGSGTRVAVGTVNKDTESSYTISVPFEPTGCIVMLVDGKGRKKSTVCVSSLTKFPYTSSDKHKPGSHSSVATDYTTPHLSADTLHTASVSGKTITVAKGNETAGKGKHSGTYLYVAWDGDP